MKKRITVEQLNELPEKQKDKLRALWELEICDHVTVDFINEIMYEGDSDNMRPNDNDKKSIILYETHDKNPRKMYPLLDIGQMIELLEDSLEDNGHYCEIRWCKYEELCDILWQSVKEVLVGCESE